MLRTSQGKGRRELAEASGLSYSYLAEIENGTKQPSSKSMLAIAEALGIPAHELMEFAESWRDPSLEETADETGEPDEEVAVTEVACLSEPPRIRRLAGPARLQAFRSARREASSLLPSPMTASDDSDLEDDYRSGELIRLFIRLPPEDQQRLLDMARRLAGV